MTSPHLAVVDGKPSIQHKKAPVDERSLSHRNLRSDEFWRRIPAWKDVDEPTFLNHLWQEKNAIISPEKLVAAVQELASPAFIDDVTAGFKDAPMAVRISPYVLSLIDWSDPYRDPLRRQFLPVASQLEPD
ncbi:MAG TPA: KamA family radical SAM protein, partial [Myxococcota bacterium]